jgi:2-iminobutanoate/2-iminopropanoate deaminase
MSQKRAIKTDKAAPPIGPYNQGVRWDRLVFTASVPTSNPQFGDATDAKSAARNALENVKAILEEGGSGLAHLLKVTLYIRDMNDFAAINEVYAEYIPDPKPVRSLVLVQGARSPVSFDAIAYVPD